MGSKNNRRNLHDTFNRKCKRQIIFKSKNNSDRKRNSDFVVHQEENNSSHKENGHEKKINTIRSAQFEYERIQKKKQEIKQQARKKKAEMEAALNKYKQKKKEKYKKLSAKTSKGQPLMKNRIELLLEEIQSSIK